MDKDTIRILTEVFNTNHFEDRINDRLYNSTISQSDRSNILKQIRSIYGIKTPNSPQLRIAVRVFKSNEILKVNDYHRQTNYLGNEIWVIVQRRAVKTLLVGNSSQTNNQDFVKGKFQVTDVFYSPAELKNHYSK